MPKGSEELTKERENEIIDACKKLYRTNFVQISSYIVNTTIANNSYFRRTDTHN